MPKFLRRLRAGLLFSCAGAFALVSASAASGQTDGVVDAAAKVLNKVDRDSFTELSAEPDHTMTVLELPESGSAQLGNEQTGTSGGQTAPDLGTTPDKVEAEATGGQNAQVVEETETPSQTAEPESTSSGYGFVATRQQGGLVSMSGSVPAEATRRYFQVLGQAAAVEELMVTPGAPDDFLPSATAGLRALTSLYDGELRFGDGAWTLSGTAMDAGAKAAAEAEVAALSETGAWTVQIALPSARTLCQIRVTAFATQNSILFQSGSATIAESSGPALDTIASVLAECPDATVNVEGHTDADGDDRRNLALSVARAEAVIEALIQRGIAPERLYALGYGETVPIAPNESAEGKRLNRRIVFTLLEDEEAES